MPKKNSRAVCSLPFLKITTLRIYEVFRVMIFKNELRGKVPLGGQEISVFFLPLLIIDVPDCLQILQERTYQT